MLTLNVGLHDAEKDHMKNKSFPNYALMKLSAYHKARGDTVIWWKPLDGEHYDIVYSSKVFDFTPENPYLPANTYRGGTGYGVFDDVSKGIYSHLSEGVDAVSPDYSIYPDCDYAIGYLTRGCIRSCAWCVVPLKEGHIKPYRYKMEVLRPDTDKLVLMDNNILACSHGIEQLEVLAYSQKYEAALRVCWSVSSAAAITPNVMRLMRVAKTAIRLYCVKHWFCLTKQSGLSVRGE